MTTQIDLVYMSTTFLFLDFSETQNDITSASEVLNGRIKIENLKRHCTVELQAGDTFSKIRGKRQQPFVPVLKGIANSFFQTFFA